MIEFFPTHAIAFTIGGFAVHWYGIMYLLGFLVAFVVLPNIQHERKLYLNRDEWASIISAAVIGVIAGGRLGYVLFYEPEYFADNLPQIFAVWQGGMSSHGGFIGVTLALLLVCWRMKLDIRRVADVTVIPIAVGLALGRLGNFINYELYGTITSVPWAIEIPGVNGLRHPTQIYAILKDLFIAGACFLHLHYGKPFKAGRTAALFLMLYGVMRFVVEHFREQTYPLTDFGIIELTRGQLLTIPIVLVGALLWMIFKEVSKQ